MKVPFLDLNAQYKFIKHDIDKAVKKVYARGDFILGADVKLFEQEFAAYCGCKYAIGVNSGTDALFFSLLALGIGKGDEIICPVYTYIATSFAIDYVQARPVFVDIDPKTYNIDVAKIEAKITKQTKAIMPVHLYGQPADMRPILNIARKYKLKVIEDAAQAHGALYQGQRGKGQGAKTGAIGDVGCFSFYPTKNLGAYGDGGMITTNNTELNKRLLKLRDYGRIDRYTHESLGYNSRLDTIQAAILRIKLKYIDSWNKARREKAALYNKCLQKNKVVLPFEAKTGKHVYHVFAVRVQNRPQVIKALQNNNIGVLIHYPLPLHLQPVYKKLGYKKGDFPVAETVANEVISLPIYPELNVEQIKYIGQIINKAA